LVAKSFPHATASSVEARENDFIHIEQLEVFARIGVTENERANPQRLTLSITVWPNERFEDVQDDITRTVNYSAISVATREFVGDRSDKLIETLAADFASHLLKTFPVTKVRIELRKFVLPEAQYAAVTVTRTAAAG
jgi:dihydroneopterin aldolase